MSDTVGFIHKLPTILVAAFRATLEEAHEADLLVHVVDVSSPYAAEQSQVVEDVLDEMGIGETPRILALNKWDLVASGPDTNGAGPVSQPDLADDQSAVVFTSAIKGWGIDSLREEIDHQLNALREIAGTASAAAH